MHCRGVPEEYQKKRETVEHIAESLCTNIGMNGKYFAVRDGRINVIYQNRKEDVDAGLLERVRCREAGVCDIRAGWTRVYAHRQHGEDAGEKRRKHIIWKRFLIWIRYMCRGMRLIRLYQYVVCILLGACVGISLGLSYLLTHRLSKMSESASRLSNGDLDCRAEVKGKDADRCAGTGFQQHWRSSLQEKMEEISDQAKRQEHFTAAFAHELKTPLTAIIGYAELIRSVDDLSPEERVKAADYIYAQGKRLQKLSYKLMELFVLKQQDMEFQELPAQYLLRQVGYLVEVSMLRSETELVRRAEKGVLYGEQDLLLSLFANLVDNARKASQKGAHIYLTGQAEPDGYTVIVRDEGKGMEKTEIDKITQAFYMVDKSRSRKEGGAGLGMTLCQEIIHLHKATWLIESEPGKGTTITMHFPKKEDSQ